MKEPSYFEYIVEFYDEEKKTMIKNSGITFALNYTDAADNLERYYGNIENFYIQGLEAATVYDFKDSPITFSLIANRKKNNNYERQTNSMCPLS